MDVSNLTLWSVSAQCSKVLYLDQNASKFDLLNTKKMPGEHRNRKSYRDSTIPRGTHLSKAQRAEILTLFYRARWNKSKIAKELRIARITVILTIRRGICTPKMPVGRPFLLTMRKRRRLI
jgi:transcriptional regulator with PAS, ATPase and Fis domain